MSLRRVVAAAGSAWLGRYPLQREFVAAGEGGLYRRIKTTAGHAAWAQRMGVARSPGRA